MRVLAALALAALLTACATDDPPESGGAGIISPEPAPSAATASAPTNSASSPADTDVPTVSPSGGGQYISERQYRRATPKRSDKVILFFYAPWCEDCVRTDESITASGVAPGFVIVKVDFDSSETLRKKYQVAEPPLFVQVDSAGDLIAEWTGSYTADEIVGLAQ